MMFATPKFVVTKPIKVLNKIYVSLKLQHRMLSYGVVGREKSAELDA
jgi:hypothetical protein